MFSEHLSDGLSMGRGMSILEAYVLELTYGRGNGL
jgi:hypothetical protein